MDDKPAPKRAFQVSPAQAFIVVSATMDVQGWGSKAKLSCSEERNDPVVTIEI